MNIALTILIITVFAAACKPIRQLNWRQSITETKRDTVNIQVHQDSTHIDTVLYSKKYTYTEKAPKTLHGSWYVVATLIVAVVAILILRK